MADAVVGGVRLHYERLGDRVQGHAPAVFLHGLVMDNLSSWYFTVANAAAQLTQVLVYDLRGHGKSERPQTGYTLDAMVFDLAGLLDAALGPDVPVHLVGNSFGGLLALAFAAQHPARTAGLVLVDAHLGDEGFGAQMATTLGLEGEERDRAIAASFQDWLGRHSERKRNRLADNARALVSGTSLIADMRGTPPLRAEALARITAPTLALYGERSDLRPKSERVLSALPHSTLRIIPGCTHSILWEATERVRTEILDFLRERSGTGAPR
jgi:pimeloyl-ACP methyl ester carboxylesterase